jgi:hypothetical protein
MLRRVSGTNNERRSVNGIQGHSAWSKVSLRPRTWKPARPFRRASRFRHKLHKHHQVQQSLRAADIIMCAAMAPVLLRSDGALP